MNKIQKAYLAGLFDGEGYFCLLSRVQHNRRSGFKPVVGINMTCKKTINLVHHLSGIGTVRVKVTHPLHKTQWVWTALHNQAKQFTRQIFPFLVTKKDAAIIEGSKVFAKEFMKKFNIPTADFKVFTNSDSAIEFIKGTKKQFVIKADGLAAGKGVIIPKNKEEALHAVQEIMESKKFGEAGNQIIIEDKYSHNDIA